ncbi:MAG: glycosyltransferase [Acidobacteriota bacterium]
MPDVSLETEATTETSSGPSAESRIRTAIAVIVTRFPRIDETFILREIDELERNGQPVLVVPIAHGGQTIVHEEAKPWVKRALYTPFLSAAILRSNLRALIGSPKRYLGLLLTVVAGTWWRPSTLIRSLSIIPKAVHLARVLPALGVRHIHAHFATHATTMAYAISAMSDLSYSFTVHGPDVFVHRLLLREKIRGAQFIRCISTFNKAFLSGLYPHLTEGKLDVVHSGLSPDVYAEAARQSSSRRGRPLLLSVAALTPRHGYPFLIDACARLIRDGLDLECRIVGDGPLRGTTEQWIEQHGLTGHVRILGNLPQHEVARLMGEADVFVLPGIIAVDGQMEGIPISLMEAMAAGKPVVAAAISGIPELVQHETSGILVDATYAHKLAEAVRRLLEDQELRKRLGRAAQQRVRNGFDIQQTARALIALFDRHHHDHLPETGAQRIAALDWARLGVLAVGARKIHERPASLVAEVTISDGITKRDVIVRQTREGDGARRRAREEFEKLSVLRQTMSQDGLEATGGIVYAVPKLLMFDEPHRAVVLSRADGKALSGLMREVRTRAAFSRLAVAVRRAGSWLSVMQQHTHGDDDGRHVLTAVVHLALRDLELVAAGHRPIRRAAPAIRRSLRALETRLAAVAMPVVGHHGNFRPDNIFIGDRRVEVIDFGCYREGLPLEDVAHLLLHLELRYGQGRGLARLERELLQGFGDAAPDPDALKLFTLTKALELLAHEGESPTLAGWRRLRALRAIIARHSA